MEQPRRSLAPTPPTTPVPAPAPTQATEEAGRTARQGQHRAHEANLLRQHLSPPANFARPEGPWERHPGAPVCRPWERMGSFSGRSVICGQVALGVERAMRGSEARGSEPKLHGPRARLAGRRRCSARPELRVPRAACALRAPWLRGEEATPARWRWRPWFARLAQSRRWSRYLAALPRRARRAAALAASPRAARGEHSVRPRAPRCRSRSQHPPPPSLAAAARLRCSPASQ